MRYTNISGPSGASLHVVTALAGFMAFSSAVCADPREAGIWYDDTGKGAVKIEICTPTTLCGKIYWLKEPMTPTGEPKIDRYNPEPTMRTRPICGLPVLGHLEQLSGGGFDNGWVYDPKVGKSYSVALDLIGPDTLKVTGYKGMKFLGKSFIWTRAPDDLPSCATSAEAAPGKVNDQVATTRSRSAKKKKKAGHKAASQMNKTDKKAVRATTQQRPVVSN